MKASAREVCRETPSEPSPVFGAGSPDLRLVPVLAGQPRRAVEAYIRRRFAEQHQAQVTHFLPGLMGLQAHDGTLHGAVGLRGAAKGALFLEQYLDGPIEQAIRPLVGHDVVREEIVEVGNLAADGRGTARRLIVELSGWLSQGGFRWVAFTGTPALLNSFQRLGLPLTRIASADPARVGAQLSAWGRYYDLRPQVMVGEIPVGCRVLAAMSGGDLDAVR
jgi:Thermostable hemolysin